MYSDLKTLCVTDAASIRDAVALIDRNRLGIILLVDEDRRLVGTITDGDVRRALLADIDLTEPVQVLLERKEGTQFTKPITAPVGTDRETTLEIFKKHCISHLPLLDPDDCVVGLVSLDDFVSDGALPLQAVVMAGGMGNRLFPLTENMPKPMLDVGGRPLLEIIIQQLRQTGIRKVKVTTHYHSSKIEKYFGDGHDLDVDLSFISEDQPLGTAGGLGLVETPTETTLVINGDILTQVDFRAMLAYHREHTADLTVAVRPYMVKVPYGVIECKGPMVSRIDEKPTMKLFVNAGIYLMEPSVHQLIPRGSRFDMTDLIQRLIEKGCPVASFPIRESWIDIGQHEDYQKAQKAYTEWELDTL